MTPRCGIDTSILVRLLTGEPREDFLIADDYARAGLEVLTLDRRMASLADVRCL